MTRTLFTVCLLLASTAQAQTKIYRCGPDGRELTQKPCSDGQQVDPRTGAAAVPASAKATQPEAQKPHATPLIRAVPAAGSAPSAPQHKS